MTEMGNAAHPSQPQDGADGLPQAIAPSGSVKAVPSQGDGGSGTPSGFWRAVPAPESLELGAQGVKPETLETPEPETPESVEPRRDRAALFETPLPSMLPPPPMPAFGRRDRQGLGEGDAIALMAERAALKKRIAQLEEALEECRATLELQLLHAQAQDDLLTQQGDEMEAASATVEGLLGELESLREEAEQQLSRFQDEIDQLQQRSDLAEARVAELETLLSQRDQDGQRQGILTETLSRQLEASQARVAQLERACALLQQRNLERATQLAQAEQLGQELRSRLHRQQRQTLQFRAALEQCLDLQGRRQIPDVMATDEPDSVLAELLDQAPSDPEAAPGDLSTVETWSEAPGDRGIHPWAPLAATPTDDGPTPPPDSEIAPLGRVELPSFGHSGSLVRDGALRAEDILALLDWHLERPHPSSAAAPTPQTLAPSDRPAVGIRVGVWEEATAAASEDGSTAVGDGPMDEGTDAGAELPGDRAETLPPIAHILENGADLLEPPPPPPTRQPLNLPQPHAIAPLAAAVPVPNPDHPRIAAPVLYPDQPRRRRRPTLASVELPRFR